MMDNIKDEIRVAICGSVSSSKSTTLSVLKYNILDNGNGCIS